MRRIRVFSLVAAGAILAAQLAVAVPIANAAPQTINNPGLTYDGSDDPVLNDNPNTTATFGGIGINSGVGTVGPTATASDSNVNQTYTWRLNSLADQMCSQATLTSLRIQANVAADTEGDPDLSAIFLYRIDGSDVYALGDYTINSGTDYSTATGGFTPPDGDGLYGVVRGSAVEFGGSLAGALDATWDLSSFSPTDTFGIMIQQDSQDGSVNLQTTISTIDLEYDDANCVVDAAATKTLLNPSSVHPGGTATYEVTLTNSGTEPFSFNGQGGSGIFDLPAEGLTYQSVTSTDVPDIECQDLGTVQDVFGNDPQLSMPYHNHLQSKMVICGSPASPMLNPGESRSFQITFAVSPGATRITNMFTYILDSDNDFSAFGPILGSMTIDGPDMVDLLLSGEIANLVNNISVSDYTFPTSSQPTSLASSGSQLVGYGGMAGLGFGAIGFAVLRRRRNFSVR